MLSNRDNYDSDVDVSGRLADQHSEPIMVVIPGRIVGSRDRLFAPMISLIQGGVDAKK